MYRRNRYYDPHAGHFTQEDPIGLAGGVNAYGFAAGDPVSYGDPYGLSAEDCCTYGYDTGLAPPRITWADVRNFVNRHGVDILFGGAAFLEREEGNLLGRIVGREAEREAENEASIAARAAAEGYPRDFATENTTNWSSQMATERDARNLAREKIGSDPVQVGRNKWRSRDGRWQYRAKDGDIADRHIHLEQLNPRTGEVTQNLHLRW